MPAGMEARTVIVWRFAMRILLFAVALTLTTSPALSDTPPEGTRPLSEIAAAVERMNLGVITGIEMDDGRWEVEICGSENCVKLHVDPKTGEVLKRRNRSDCDEERPPKDAIPLSRILGNAESGDGVVVKEVEFDDGYWEIDLVRDGRERKIKVHPLTGELRGKS
jgi:uncharacterized membrane protein YkoI